MNPLTRNSHHASPSPCDARAAGERCLAACDRASEAQSAVVVVRALPALRARREVWS